MQVNTLTCFSGGICSRCFFLWCCSSLAFEAYCLWQCAQEWGWVVTEPTVAEKVRLAAVAASGGLLDDDDPSEEADLPVVRRILDRADSGKFCPGWFFNM